MTFAEFKTNLLDDLSVTSSDLFFTDDILGRFINRSIRWAAGLHAWPQTESAVYRDSVAGQEYYNIPENVPADSIYLLEYNGEFYKKLRWREYQKYKSDNGTGATDKVFSDFGNRIFINPAPAVELVGGIVLWSQKTPDELSGTTDVTPFQGNLVIEEAILKHANGRLLVKQRGSFLPVGRALMAEAKSELDEEWERIMKDQSDYKTKEASMFDVPNFYQHNGHTKTGSFENCN